MKRIIKRFIEIFRIPKVAKYTTEAIFTLILYLVTKSHFIISFYLMILSFFEMLMEYNEQGRKLSFRKSLVYVFLILGFASSLIFRSLGFLKIKVILTTLFLSFFLITSPFYMLNPPQFRFYKLLLKSEDSKVLSHVNFLAGAFGIGLAMISIWSAVYLETSKWMFFKTIITPTLIFSFAITQYLLHGNKDDKD